MSKRFLRLVLIISLVTLIIGCSAGGGETGTGADDDTVSVGVITGFGSVYVNDIKYETNDTTVTLDGAPASESALRVGMIVSLKGSINNDGVTGTASSIAFEDNVEGVVLANNIIDSNRLDIMGQIVIVDNDTIFESQVTTVTSLAEIQVDNIVEVSGYTSGDGTIYATRVEVKQAQYTSGEEMEVEGLATNVTATHFNIGRLTFSYTNTVLEDFDGQDFVEGALVEVTTSQAINGLEAIADKVEFKKANETIDSNTSVKNVELEGVISVSVNAQDEFQLNSQLVRLTTSTVFEQGDKTALIKGARADVEGSIQDGVLIATEIEVKQQSSSQIAGSISAINTAMQIITVAGQDVQINSSTRLQDEDDDSNDDERRYFNFSNLRINDYVEISGYTDTSSNLLIATKLERDEPEDAGDTNGWELEDVIDSIDLPNNTIIVGGQEVNIAGIVFTGQAGDSVELEGNIVDGVWIATDISYKTEFEVEGQVLSIDLENNQIVLSTENGDISIDISYIIFNARVGDDVEIEGQIINEVLVASEMEIDSSESSSKSEESNESEEENSTDSTDDQTPEIDSTDSTDDEVDEVDDD